MKELSLSSDNEYENNTTYKYNQRSNLVEKKVFNSQKKTSNDEVRPNSFNDTGN